jgi:hypothetical protein
MALHRARINSLVFGLIVGVIVGQGSGVPTSTAAPKEPPARLVVGLKGPLTPAVVKELRRTFGNRIVQMAPIGANTLVLLRRGETLEEVQRRSRLIAYVEPEVVMGAAPMARSALVVIPAPRWQKAPLK